MTGLFVLPVTGAATGGSPFLGRRSPIVGASLGGSFAVYYDKYVKLLDVYMK
jgi:hypothetical protein